MRRICIAALALLCGIPAGAGASPGHYAKRADVRAFIAEMADHYGFARGALRKIFAQARYQPAIVRAMTPPPEAPVRSWRAYRALFLDRQRIDGGKNFRERYAATLKRAAKQFGVPPEIIVAILGVETLYGRNMGTHRMIDTFATLAFDFPPRSRYFRSELVNFLLYAREDDIDVLAARGSYAGAFGIPQFMPGSYRRYALDYDGDGRINLSSSPVDAIGSVANYLKARGWRSGQPVAAPAQVRGKKYRVLIEAGIKPSYRVADLPGYGVSVRSRAGETLPAKAKCALVELDTPHKPAEYWVGLHDFYVLTRYNRSSFYAIAVYELSRAIAADAP